MLDVAELVQYGKMSISRQHNEGDNMTRFEKYKSQGHVHATAITVAFGKVTAFENLSYGDDSCMVVFTEAGKDVSDAFDAWDVETFRFLANDL